MPQSSIYFFYPNANWLKKFNAIFSANQIRRQSFAALSIGWTDSICSMIDSIECWRLWLLALLGVQLKIRPKMKGKIHISR